VEVKIWVDPSTGRVIRAEVHRSSGHRHLDNAALAKARARTVSIMQLGVATDSTTVMKILPIIFELDEDNDAPSN